MLATVRRAAILEQLHRSGSVSITELKDALRVSAMTVRRDLDALAGEGLMIKVHGGAVEAKAPRTPAVVEAIPLRVAMAVAACGWVQPGMRVAVPAAAGAGQVAESLAGIAQLTVVTNSLDVVERLQRKVRNDRSLILVGGTPSTNRAVVGPVALGTIRSLNVDVSIVGVEGIDADNGLTVSDLWQAEVCRAFVEKAKHVVAMADAQSWGRAELAAVCTISEIDAWVTDSGLAGDAVAGIDGLAGKVIRVSAETAHARVS